MYLLICILACIALACITCSDDEIAGSDAAASTSPFTVGVYYYPWYLDDFHGGRYLRPHLVPPQMPTLGEYNDRRPEVIAQHLAWSRQANISLWAASWWGPDSREDLTLRQQVLPHPEIGDMKIAILYETQGRTRGFEDSDNLATDVTHLATHYFDHPNYLRIDGKPVIFIYLTRVLSARGRLSSNLEIMRDTAHDAGYELYIIGDHVFGQPPTGSGDIGLLDGITNYDVYGSMGARGYAGQQAVNAYYAAQSGWRELARAEGVAFIPAVTPGFNDRGVRDGHEPVSRRLGPKDEFGSLFRAMLQQVRNYVEPATGNMFLITSWNEWHEDTQIEPLQKATATSTDDSPTGQDFTSELDYEGYGERYLRILREETAR